MSRLVYLSPVGWADFAQRPHKFVEWHHARHGSEVLWLEPYPTRLPNGQDLRRLRARGQPLANHVPPWLCVRSVPALPVEPLPGGTLANALLWRRVLPAIAEFAAGGACELVVGKPSQLALQVIRAIPFRRTVYDAMDDFPAFHAGLSARSMRRAEQALAGCVDLVQASSSRLQAKFSGLGAATVLVRNACDPAALPAFTPGRGPAEPDLVGYIGMIASWFDWEVVCSLARSRPDLRFRLIGPVRAAVPAALPANIELKPPCAHPAAMREMARFAVGLIPFRHTPLTAAVDPVKYYEYRALGVPVLSTAFGEMPEHAREDAGVFIVDDAADARRQLVRALAYRDDAQWVRAFRERNSWEARFRSVPAA